MINTNISVECKGGGSINDNPAVFSSDGGTVFISWSNYILSYNTKTGKKLLQYEGLNSKIIGFTLRCIDGYECMVACSHDGEIITWKTETGYKLLKHKLYKKDNVLLDTFNVFPPSTNDDDSTALCSYKSNERINFVVTNLTTRARKPVSLVIKDEPYKIDVGPRYFVVVQGSQLYYVKMDSQRIIKHSISDKLHFTCVKCHPEEQCLLTGDSLGRVVLWHNLTSQNPSKSVYHWHTLPVRCIAFSTTGSYFYSGGAECVLVKWQMDNSLQKNFLPRLPSAIEHVSVANNNVFIAISTGDNAVRVLDSRLETVSVIQNMVVSGNEKGNMVFDMRSKALIMNGTVGHLQFYSPYDMSLLYTLDVAGRNQLTQERNTHIENIDIMKIAVSKSGTWMSTVEQRDEINFAAETRMKFWKFDVAKQKFALNTSIEYPHTGIVKDVLFQPSNNENELKCVTIGDDSKFKIWQLQEVITPYHKGHVWKCTRVGFYKNLPANALAFSYDGSLLGVGFEHTVTAWMPDTCELKCSLLHTTHRLPIGFLEFGVDTQCHLVVAATAQYVCVWNLLTLTMIWTVSVPVAQLVADTMTPYMAVFTKENKLFVFSPASHQPVYTSDNILPITERVLGASFVPSLYVNDSNLNWYQRSQLFYITSNKELYSLSTNEEVIEPVSEMDATVNSSLFTLMQPKLAKSAVTNSAPVQHKFTKQSNQKTLEKLWEMPAHTMPPVRLFCEAILRSMVLQKDENVT